MRKPGKNHTSLRDYGAFRIVAAPSKEDITTQATRKMVALSPSSTLTAHTVSLPGVPLKQETMVHRSALPAPVAVVAPFPKVGKEDELFIPPDNELRSSYAQSVGEEVQKAAPRKWLSLAGRVAFTGILFFFLLRTVSWEKLGYALGNVHHVQLLVGLGIGALGIVISSYQWRSLLHAERIQSDLAALIDLYLVGIAFSHFLPTGMGGDAVKALYVSRSSGNSVGSTSAVIMSRVTGFFGMLVMAVPMLVFWHASIRQDVIVSFVLLALLVGAMIGGAIGASQLLPYILPKRVALEPIGSLAGCSQLLPYILPKRVALEPIGSLAGCSQLLPYITHTQRLVRMKRVQGILNKVTEVGNALYATLKRPRFLSISTLFGLQFWIVSCLNYYCYAAALGIQVPFYFYAIAIPFVSLVTFLPISINGFGVRESVFVYIFSTMHVSASSSLLLALLMDAQVLFFGLVGGIIYLRMGSQRG
jgi:uncharacterized membrane protein YbhN (UPF0104 family)